MILPTIANLTILAASAEAQNFTKVSWVALLIAGLLFFLLGLFIGWRIWRHYRARALRVEEENRSIRSEHERREKKLKEHRARFAG